MQSLIVLVVSSKEHNILMAKHDKLYVWDYKEVLIWALSAIFNSVH